MITLKKLTHIPLSAWDFFNALNQSDLPHNMDLLLKFYNPGTFISQTTTLSFTSYLLDWVCVFHFDVFSRIMDLKKISKLTEMLSACRELEEVAGGLYENLQDAQRQELHNSTKKAAEEARKQRAKVAKEFPPAQRARCTAQSRLQVTLDELNETLMSNAQQEKLGCDCVIVCFFRLCFFVGVWEYSF